MWKTKTENSEKAKRGKGQGGVTNVTRKQKAKAEWGETKAFIE